MVNRKRNIHLHLMFTKEEKELLKSLADLKNMSMTNMILEWIKKEYEKLEQQ